MAFGSTRPRGLMPGHLASDAPPRALRNIKKREAHMAKIRSLAFEADKRRADVYKVMGQHKKRQVDYLSSQQLKRFYGRIKGLHDSDEGLRPSDKAGAFRDYSNIDKDLWAMSELRNWFNKYPSNPPTFDMFAGGATLGRAELPPGAADRPKYVPRAERAASAMGSVRSGSRGSAARSSARPTTVASLAGSRASSASSLPDVKTMTGRAPPPRKSHWLDFEGNVREQERMESKLRKTGLYDNAAPPRPWKDRLPEDEGPVLSVAQLKARDADLYVDSAARSAQMRDMKERTRKYLQGEGHDLLMGR